MKVIVLSAKSFIPRPSLRRGFLLILLLLGCFGLAPMAQAVGPDTDGAIPGSNNGEGLGVLVTRTVGVWNTGTGFQALNHLTGGNQNTATGLRALTSDTNGGFNTATGVFSLFSNANGFFNSATGAYSLANNISGTHNTANGYAALYRNTADNNTATGFAALYKNTTGSDNVAVGYQALLNNTIGGLNTANGALALLNNTTGVENTAIGRGALRENITGFDNTATGESALNKNTDGDRNTATGVSALFANTIGTDNTANGRDALSSNTTGSFNTADGGNALLNTNGGGNTAYGYNALANSTGNVNTALGLEAGFSVTTASNVICIGTSGANVSDSCFIGNIRGVTTVNAAIPVLIDTVGQLGTASSSRRYKKEIKPMDSASESILALKPVTFHYKSDATATPQFGLIAEEVAEVNPDLVVRDENGEIYTVRYDAVNAMLLNEFLKAHRKAQQQEATITELKRGIEVLTAQFKEQAAQIQKVNAQLEVTKAAPQTVSNK